MPRLRLLVGIPGSSALPQIGITSHRILRELVTIVTHLIVTAGKSLDALGIEHRASRRWGE
jgi:3-polyprenyl-4-hydroxybenzoate decarboxylase